MIGEVFASYTTQYKHSHYQKVVWKELSPNSEKLWEVFAATPELIFSLGPLAISTWQNCSNNLFSPVVGWPDSIASYLCLRAGLLVLKYIKGDTMMVPAFLIRVKSLAVNELWKSNILWSFWNSKMCNKKRMIGNILLLCIRVSLFDTVLVYNSKSCSMPYISLHVFFGPLFCGWTHSAPNWQWEIMFKEKKEAV